MKSAFAAAAWLGLAVFSGAPSFAQLQDNTQKQLTCQNGNDGGDRARHCEIREQVLPGTGRLDIDGEQNGGVTVKGALRSDVLVRARVETWADTEAAATNFAGQVAVGASGGQVKAAGPQSTGSSGWSVTYEVFVPQATDLTIKAHNGGIAISDVRGLIRFDTHNGGVHLKRVAGDVSGTTVNGGLKIELTGAVWEGRQLEASTQNGGVSIAMPSYYSAHVQAETRNGRIQSDFPGAMPAEARARNVDLNLGSGGPLIHLTTVNGGVSLKRAEAQ